MNRNRSARAVHGACRLRIEGELADLVSGRATGRRGVDEIILFKSVGTAIEDLAAAKLIVASAGEDC